MNKVVSVKQMGAAVQHIKQQGRFKTLLTRARRLKSKSENSLIEKTKKEWNKWARGQGIKPKLHVGSEDPV